MEVLHGQMEDVAPLTPLLNGPSTSPTFHGCPAGDRVCFLAEVNDVAMDEVYSEVRLDGLPSRWRRWRRGRGSLTQQKGEPRDEEGPRAGVAARGPGSVLRAGRAVGSVMGMSLGGAWLRAPGFIIAIVIVICAEGVRG